MYLLLTEGIQMSYLIEIAHYYPSNFIVTKRRTKLLCKKPFHQIISVNALYSVMKITFYFPRSFFSEYQEIAPMKPTRAASISVVNKAKKSNDQLL